MKEKTEKKPPKVPGVFRKPLKAKTFEKRYVKFIEHPDDKKFFTNLFIKQDDIYALKEGLKKDEINKLKKLFGIIKANRKGGVSFIPIAFAGIIAAAIIIFVTVFANPLLSRATEMGLEAIFEAKANVYGFRLNIFRFSINISGITVADRDKPMTNLFEMGRTIVSLNSAAVLRGKIYINEISAASIRFGTPRTVSGALPNRAGKEKPEKEQADTPPLVDLKNFDAMALLNQEYEKLSSPKLYDEAINAYNGTREKYTGQVDLAKKRSMELQDQAQPFLKLNVADFNYKDTATITKVKSLIQDITALSNTVQATANDAAVMIKGLETDINLARSLEQSARNAVTSDINHLKSYIDLGSGAAFAVLDTVIRNILSSAGEQYLDYGIRALEILEQLKANAMVQSAIDAAKTPKAETPKKEVFKGRDVAFPVRNYPAFYLGRLSSDFTIDNQNWVFDLRNVNSSPDLVQINPFTGEPGPAVTLSLGFTEEDGAKLNRKVNFRGSADFRTEPIERFSAIADGSGFPLALGNELNKIGIKGFKGLTDFSVNLSGRTDGGMAGGGKVLVNQAQVIEPQGTIAEAIGTAVREVKNINLGIQYTHWADQKDEFKITTNIGELVTKALKAAASAYAKQAMDAIEKALREKINQYIDGRFAAKEDVDALFRLARGDKAAIDQLKNSLETKKNEFEQRIKAAGEQVKETVKEEAKEQSQQAAQDVLQGNKPTVNIPTLPPTGGIKIPGR